MKTVFTFALIAFLILSCTDKKKAQQDATSVTLPVYTIKSGSGITYKEFPASVQGTADIEIRPQVTGTLDKIFVDEGSYVTTGQPLFKINENTYREQVNSAAANVSASESALINAQLEIDKLTPLVQNKVVSEYQLKTAQATLKIALSNLAQSKAVLAASKINLGYTLIRSPLSGYIGRLLKKQGSQIAPSDAEPLTQLSDIKNVYAYFSIGESEFVNFKSNYKGKTINDKLKNLPPVTLILSDNSIYKETGRIDMVDGQFDKNTGAITLRAKFPNTDGLIRSGNTGKIKLAVQHSNVLMIPQAATVEVQDKVFVFSLDKNNKANKTAVTVLGKSGSDYLISGGIKNGDHIVLKGFENLKEGTVVKPEKSANATTKI